MPHSLPHRQPGGDEAAKSRSSSSSSSSGGSNNNNNNNGPSSAIPGHRSLPQTKQPDDTKELSPCLMGEEQQARTLPRKERTEATAADDTLCAPSSPGNTNNRSHRAAPDRKTLEPNTLPLDVTVAAAETETEAASREPRVPRRKERLETNTTESSASSVSSANPKLPPSVATESLMQLIPTTKSGRKRSPVEGSGPGPGSKPGVDAMLVEPSSSDNPPHSASHESKKRGHQRSKPNADVNMDYLASSVGTLNNTTTCDVEGASASAERTEALANVEEGKSTTATATMGVGEGRVPLKSAAKSAAPVNQQDREYQEAVASQKEEPKKVSVHYREDFKKRSDVIGVGYNRIRIEPLREERTKGSAADIVVQKLLVQYDSTKAKETGIQAGLEAPNKELLPEDIEEGDKKPSAEPTLMGATADSTEMDLGTPLGISPNASKRQVAPFVHNMGIFSDPKSLQAAPRKDERVAPPITLEDEERTNQLIRVMRDVPKDTKLDIINRRTGRVLRGDAGMTPSELAEQMQLDVALEPMVAIRPGESDSILVSSRASRILTDRNSVVRSGVRRQTRLARPFRKGEMVSVTSGEHKNVIGEFDQSLPAGWVSIKQIVPLDGPSAVIVQASVVQRHDSKESRRHSIQEGKRKRRKIISEEEIEQIFLNSVESSLKSAPGKGGLDTHTKGGSSTTDLQLGLSSRQTALKYVVEAFGRKDF